MNVKKEIKIANFITLKAKPGKEGLLAEFLAGGAGP